MNILDLFSGIGGFAKAFEDVFGKDHQHYYSEIDKYAIAVYRKQFPTAIALGDVTKINVGNLPPIDFLFSGSPCQSLSIAGNREGLAGKSGLFHDAVRIWKQTKPKYWIFENVASMAKSEKQKITDILGVEAICINSSLVSAQQRKRLYWTNIPNITQPEDRKIYLKDVLEKDVPTSFHLSENENRYMNQSTNGKYSNRWSFLNDIEKEKSQTLVSNLSKGVPYNILRDKCIKAGYINNSQQQNRVYFTNGKSITLDTGCKGLIYINKEPPLIINNKEVILGDYDLQIVKEGRTELGKVRRQQNKKESGKDSTSRGSGNKALYGREGDKMNCSPTSLGAEGLIINKKSDDYIIRKLTPVECCRLQCFPDDWNSLGIFETKKGLEELPISNTQRYKQCGNAVTVEVIKHILSFVKL